MDQHQHPSTTTFAMELTGKIMVAAIFILFLVVVFVLILQLYSRWLLSRIDDSAARPSDHESPVSTLRKGLDAAVLRSIPTVVFSAEDFKDVLECAVCLSELEEGEKARLLPMCNHGFHVDCIDMWFHSNSTCPLCRNPVPPSSSNPSELKDLESPIFPTNVLFWGNQMQISSLGVCLEEPQTSSSSSSSTNIRTDGMVVVDIPNDPSSSSSGAGAGECSGHEEMKSAVTNRLRTLKRLLSRERSICSNSNSLDLEQVGRVQS